MIFDTVAEARRICTDIGESDHAVELWASLQRYHHPGAPSFLRMTRRPLPDEKRQENDPG
jgi:hypothetical protein